jgi:hypothetical protein
MSNRETCERGPESSARHALNAADAITLDGQSL